MDGHELASILSKVTSLEEEIMDEPDLGQGISEKEKKDNSKKKSLKFHCNELNIVYLAKTSGVPVKQ